MRRGRTRRAAEYAQAIVDMSPCSKAVGRVVGKRASRTRDQFDRSSCCCEGDGGLLPSCNMIRSLLRTSDACRAALGIAHGTPGKRTTDSSHLALSRREEAIVSNTVQTAASSSRSTAAGSAVVVPSEDRAPSLLGTKNDCNVQPKQQLDDDGSAAVIPPVLSPVMLDPEFRHSQSLEANITAAPKTQMRASTVPSSRFGRLFQYGGATFPRRERGRLQYTDWPLPPAA